MSVFDFGSEIEPEIVLPIVTDVWLQLVKIDLDPMGKIVLSSSYEEKLDFIISRLSSYDARRVCLSCSGTKESLRWKCFDLFDVKLVACAYLNGKIGEFLIFDIAGAKCGSIQEDEYNLCFYEIPLKAMV